MKQSVARTLQVIDLVIIIAVSCIVASSQTNDYMAQYKSGNYQNALNIINKQLDGFYFERLNVIRIPTEFITTKNDVQEIDLKKLFKNRKASGFFIEKNNEASNLHLYAARCHFKLSKYNDSLNHYIQSLRFTVIENKKDDGTFYEISQVYKKLNKFNAYINVLESAHMLNPDNYSYSFEIGSALYKTKEKKRAIFHLERYVTNTDEEIDPKIFIMLGNLFEDISKYLQTEKYYAEYITKRPNDGNIHFALGYIAFYHTGNYKLSIQSLNRALELLPKEDILRRSRAYEYKGDIEYHNLEFREAIKSYTETIKYQKDVLVKIDSVKKEIKDITNEINRLKTALIKEKSFEQYEEYEMLQERKGKKELALQDIENQFKKLNAGRIRWNIADAYERLEELDKAVLFYREALAYNYKSNHAREKIIKLQLKIKRGY